MSIASELSALNGYILGAYDEINDKGGTVPANKNMANLAPAIISIPSGSSINTTTIEIGENNVTQAAQLYSYFLPYFQGAIALLGIELVESTYTVNNQFVRFRYGANTSYNSGADRWRNGSVGSFAWNAPNYDAKIVAGTHYTITWISTGSSTTIAPLSVTENGTYTAPTGTAYSPVTVNVSGSSTGITREVDANGVYGYPTQSFTFSLPSDATDLAEQAIFYAFYGCTSLTSVDFSSLTTISGGSALNYAFQGCTSLTSVDLSSLTAVSGSSALYYAFQGCTSLTSVDLSSLTTVSGSSALSSVFRGCTSLTTVDLSSLTTVSGSNALQYAFQGCTNLTSVGFSALTTVSESNALQYVFQGCTNLTSVGFSALTDLRGYRALYYAFQNCTSLTSVSFPALTTSSFGSYTNQFNNMLKGVTGCTVHFPAAIQSTIGSWSDVTNGFSGTNTTVLFDL